MLNRYSIIEDTTKEEDDKQIFADIGGLDLSQVPSPPLRLEPASLKETRIITG